MALPYTLLFDFDGTLIDSFGAVMDLLKTMATEQGYPQVAAEQLQNKSVKELIAHLQVPYLHLPMFIKRIHSQLRNQMADMHPIAHMHAALQELKEAGYSMAIISSNTQENINAFLKAHAMEFFDAIYCDSNLFGKSRVINKFLKKYNLKHDHVVYIGDEVRDIEAAHKSHITSVAVTWGFNSKELLASGNPDYLASTPSELVTIIKQL